VRRGVNLRMIPAGVRRIADEQRTAVEPDCPGAGDGRFYERCCAPGGMPVIGARGIAAALKYAGGDPACRCESGGRKRPSAARQRAPAHRAGELKKNAAHLLESAGRKFRRIEDQRETFKVRVVCDGMGGSKAGYMPGVAGPKLRARRPIAPCLPGSGGSIRHIWDGIARPDPRGLAWPRAHGEPRSHATLRVERLMHHHGIRARTPRRFRVRTTNSHHDVPVAANRLGQKFAAGRPNQIWPGPHPLRANRRRLALSGRRARSFHPQNRRLGDARPHAGGIDPRSSDHGHKAAKAASRPHSPFRSRPPIRRRRLPLGSRRGRDDPIHAPEGKVGTTRRWKAASAL
jgi:hypothetical protein